jgi:hypothetical protein
VPTGTRHAGFTTAHLEYFHCHRAKAGLDLAFGPIAVASSARHDLVPRASRSHSIFITVRSPEAEF